MNEITRYGTTSAKVKYSRLSKPELLRFFCFSFSHDLVKIFLKRNLYLSEISYHLSYVFLRNPFLLQPVVVRGVCTESGEKG